MIAPQRNEVRNRILLIPSVRIPARAEYIRRSIAVSARELTRARAGSGNIEASVGAVDQY